MEEDEIFNLTNVLRNIPIEHLKYSPYNKYDLFDMEDMEGSILSVGLLSPLTVIGPDDNGDYYYLSGKRRFTAIQSLNEKGQTDYKEIPCLIKGGMDVPELVQELMAESANIETRDFDKNARRFKVIRILEAMVQDGTLRKSQVRKQAGKYMTDIVLCILIFSEKVKTDCRTWLEKNFLPVESYQLLMLILLLQ